MAVLKSKKQAIFATLTNEIAKQKAIVVLTTKNSSISFNAETNAKLRKELRESGVKLQVVKNTLLNKAFEDSPALEGPSYISYMYDGSNTDEVTLPKVMTRVIKNYSDNISLLGSIVENRFLNTQETIELSTVLSKTESLAKIAGSINQITAKIALSVKEVPASIARGVNAHSQSGM